MLFNFFRKRKKPPTSSDDFYKSFVKFLTLQLSSPTDAESLISEAKDFLNLPEEKKQKEVVRIYLLFLQYCTKLDKVKKTSEEFFAKKTIGHFPELLDNKIARIPFKKEEEAKILLGSFFLNQILKPIREIAGARKGNIIDNYNQFIDKLWNEDYQAEIQISQFQLDGASVSYEDLVILSKLIHTDLSKRFGSPNIDNLYQRAYSRCESLLRDYRLFPQIIELMPVKILKQEHLKILGRGQIHKILIDQVSNLEDLNQKLVSEIDENKNLTDVLQYRTETLESILRNSLDCVIRINEKSEVTYWNQKSVEIFKHSEKEAIGKQLSDLIVPDVHKENHRIGMQRYLTTGKSKILNQTIEIEACDKMGRHFPIEISISEVREKGERSFISFLRDISQRKNYESTLIEAKNQAEETSRFKSRFFANMSHEIRTPLNAIIGFTNLLLDQNVNEEQKEYLGLIQTSGKNLMAILNDVLEISKIEEGKLQLNPKAEDFQDTIREILSPYQAIAGEKDLTFEIEFEKNFPKIISLDYYRLSQVLVNLISNATKFTQKGGIRVYFQYRFSSSNQISIRATVSDSGKGIDHKNLDKIFESFQQEDGSIARQFGGTGLGLSISKEIASVMGGTLTVESPSTHFKNKGSDFIVEIKASIEIKRTSTPLKNKEPLKQSIKLNALLVEDNPVNQKLLSTVLERMGLKISTANNGLEALEILNTKSFDIIFMDIQMPEMDGYTATQQIRKREINTPIIAISANVYPEDVKKSLDSGMQAHVGKPFNTEQLRAIITKLTSSS